MGYKTYAICSCGYYKEAPFGILFHTQLAVCPNCGDSIHNFNLKVAREVGFFNSKLEIKE